MDVVSKLYHGTDEKSANDIIHAGIDIYIGSLHTDFGPGFYLTPDIQMATQWAKRKGIFSRGVIVSYQINENDFTDYRVRRFEQPDLVWTQFIVNNRNGFAYARKMDMPENNLREQYDIVIGQIADGHVTSLARMLKEDEAAVDDEILKNFIEKKYSLQYSFHTIKAIEMLSNPVVQYV